MIRNGTDWTDTSGTPIEAHDGHITQFGDTFYWYGTSYAGNPAGLGGHADLSDAELAALQNGFRVYTSPDLQMWRFRGICLDFDEAGNGIRGSAHRPNVLHDERRDCYVMWFFDIVGYPDVMLTVAVADDPTGPFSVLGRRETGEAHGWGQDLGVFRDDDGTGYLVYDDGHRNLRVDRLTDDYRRSSGETVVAVSSGSESVGEGHEAPTMTRHRGKYVVAGSGVEGWGGTETTYAVADFPLGPYSEKAVMSAERTWKSQISNFVHTDSLDVLLVLCDQWWAGPDPGDLNQSRYLILPVRFDPVTGTAEMVYETSFDPWTYNTDE